MDELEHGLCVEDIVVINPEPDVVQPCPDALGVDNGQPDVNERK